MTLQPSFTPGWVNLRASNPFQRAPENLGSTSSLQEATAASTHHASHNESSAGDAENTPTTPKLKRLWNKVKTRLCDQYSDFNINSIPTERAVRHTYHPVEDVWKKDWVLVKVEPAPFASGAMRKCFRMKKFSNWLPQSSWKNASNLVAKQYKLSSSCRDLSAPSRPSLDADSPPSGSIKGCSHSDSVESMFPNSCSQEYPEPCDPLFPVYAADVKMQAIAKQYGEAYSLEKTILGDNVPKKVDFMMAYLIELVDRPSAPVFCVERYMSGDYTKYNTNSGHLPSHFHKDGSLMHIRHTPQTFSHYTFVKSKQSLLVCDIQGVGDLYTDPQIHTICDQIIGEGDLGVAGIALFFHTHKCNPLCALLGLSPFPCYPCDYVASFSVSDLVDSLATVSGAAKFESQPPDSSQAGAQESMHAASADACAPFVTQAEISTLLGSEQDQTLPASCAEGSLHFSLGSFHLTGRFLTGAETESIRKQRVAAVLFHLHKASLHGHREAILTLARLYAGLTSQFTDSACKQFQHELIASCANLDPDSCLSRQLFVSLLTRAARRGLKGCVLQLAHLYRVGGDEGESFCDWHKSVEWYQKFICLSGQSGGGCELSDDFEGLPLHEVYAQLAAMYLAGNSRQGFAADVCKAREYYNLAAESCLEEGKGKLATLYYSKIESLE